MADWFRAGYFTLNLMVKRSCDERYSQLGDLIKIWGRIPFMPGPTFPPIKVRLKFMGFDSLHLVIVLKLESRLQVSEVSCMRRERVREKETAMGL
jgi:hypothetical protein